jgi:hypothetical protein
MGTITFQALTQSNKRLATWNFWWACQAVFWQHRHLQVMRYISKVSLSCDKCLQLRSTKWHVNVIKNRKQEHCTDAIAACFTVLSWNSSEDTQENSGNPQSQDSWYRGWDSNPMPAEYKCTSLIYSWWESSCPASVTYFLHWALLNQPGASWTLSWPRLQDSGNKRAKNSSDPVSAPRQWLSSHGCSYKADSRHKYCS